MIFAKRKKLVAPISGEIVPITQAPDPIFSDKVLGDGVAIIPSDSAVCAPCDGTVAQIAHTLHALSITGDDGLEILLHFGIDTVSLGGAAFDVRVSVGDHVKTGDHLVNVDWNQVRDAGLDPTSPIVILNCENVQGAKFHVGPARSGETEMITYQKMQAPKS